jgi:hypothetical protein
MSTYDENPQTASDRCEESAQGPTDPTNLISRFSIIEAESETEKRERQFAKKYGVTRSDRHACVNRLIGKMCGRGNLKCVDPCPRLPAGDHLSLWNKDGKPFCIVSQPYGLSFSALEETFRFCRRYRLRAEISTWPSWHAPGDVLTVLFFRSEEEPAKRIRLVQTLAQVPRNPGLKDPPGLQFLPRKHPPTTVGCNHIRVLDLLNEALDRQAEVASRLEIACRALFNEVGQ